MTASQIKLKLPRRGPGVRAPRCSTVRPPLAATAADLISLDAPVGVRRLTVLAIQVLSEISRAHRARYALAPLVPENIVLLRPETPMECATLRCDPNAWWQPHQEREGLEALGRLLAALLQKRIYLEDSVVDRERYGGAPLVRRTDVQLLRGLHRALATIAHRLRGGQPGYVNAGAARADLDKLLSVVGRAIESRRPPPPVVAMGQSRPAHRREPPLPKVVVRKEADAPPRATHPGDPDASLAA